MIRSERWRRIPDFRATEADNYGVAKGYALNYRMVMRTHLEFRSSELLDAHDDGDTPQGKAVAKLLSSGLLERGFHVEAVIPEDWGWCVKILNPPFPLWIGCGFYPEYENGLMCFIEPSNPYIRRWLKRVSTTEVVERLASALEATLRDSGKARDLRWWNEAEVKRD